jgi:hypothetical protein
MFVLYRDCRTALTINVSEDCILTVVWAYDHEREQRDKEQDERDLKRSRQVDDHYNKYGGCHYVDSNTILFSSDYIIHNDDLKVRDYLVPASEPLYDVVTDHPHIVTRDGYSILTGFKVTSGGITVIRVFAGGRLFETLTDPINGLFRLQHRLLLPIMTFTDVIILVNAPGTIQYECKYLPFHITRKLLMADVVYDGLYYHSGLPPTNKVKISVASTALTALTISEG